MNKILLYIFLTVFPFVALSQYRVLEPKTTEPEEIPLSELDLLRQKYNGKHIQFFPRYNDASPEWQYYGNFYSVDPVELTLPYAVTLQTSRDRRISMYNKGVRKFKKMLGSIRYKSEQVNNYTTVFDDGFRHRGTKTFSRGHFTPYNVIEGQTFLVKDIREQDCLNRNMLYGLKRQPGVELPFDWNIPTYIYELEDSDGGNLFWMADKSHAAAGFIVEYIDSLKNIYVGGRYYIRPPVPGRAGKYIKALDSEQTEGYYERLSAKDIVLIGDDRHFCIPHLILEDDNGRLFILGLVAELRIDEYSRTRKYDPIQISGTKVTDLVPESVIVAEKAEEEERQRQAALKRERDAEKERQRRARLEEERQLEQQEIRRRYINKYGKKNAELILDGRVAIGMTKAMCVDAWGEPETVNRTTTSFGTSEQWVYGLGTYLYFEGNRLTGIQN